MSTVHIPRSRGASPTAPEAVTRPTTLVRPPAQIGQNRRASHAAGFWFVAMAFTALMAFGTVPTPLWQLYAARDHFGATTTTVAYASMVVGAVGAFLCLGHLSDRLGRRRVVVPALMVGIVASVVLITWQSLPGLIAGRVLTGLAMGMMASTATTYLHDLHRRARPQKAGSPLPGIVATAANLGGLAAGPLVASIVAESLPAPLTTAPALCSIALTVCLMLALATPETVDRKPRTSRPAARFALRPGRAVAFGAAGTLGVIAFANFGLTSALGAKVLQDTLRIDSHLTAGVAVFLMFASAAAAQLVLGHLPLPRILGLGCLAFPAGLALCALALYHPALWLYLIAVSLSGACSGLLFKGTIDRAMSAAAPDSRAGVLAVYFVIAYVGIGVPAIIFSIAIRHIGIEAAMIAFASVLSLAAVASTAVAARDRNGKA